MKVHTIVGVALACVLAVVPLGAQGHGHSGAPTSGAPHGNPHSGGAPGSQGATHTPQGPKTPNPGAGHAEGAGHGDAGTHGHSAEHADGTHGPMTPAESLAAKPQLAARLQGMLPAGMTVAQGADGFKNLGQFVAAVNVSKNLGISFGPVEGPAHRGLAEVAGRSDSHLEARRGRRRRSEARRGGSAGDDLRSEEVSWYPGPAQPRWRSRSVYSQSRCRRRMRKDRDRGSVMAMDLHPEKALGPAACHPAKRAPRSTPRPDWADRHRRITARNFGSWVDDAYVLPRGEGGWASVSGIGACPTQTRWTRPCSARVSASPAAYRSRPHCPSRACTTRTVSTRTASAMPISARRSACARRIAALVSPSRRSSRCCRMVRGRRRTAAQSAVCIGRCRCHLQYRGRGWRTYGSAGTLRGAVFGSGTVDIGVGPRAGVLGLLSHTYSTRDPLVATGIDASRSRTDASGGLYVLPRPSISLYALAGRTLSTIDDYASKFFVAGGVSFRVAQAAKATP